MKTDRMGYGILLVVAAVGLGFSISMPFGDLQQPGPGAFPTFIASFLIIVSAIGLLSSWKIKNACLGWHQFWGGELKVVFKVMIVVAVAIYFFEALGFLLITALFLSIAFGWISGFRPVVAIGLGAAGGLCAWLFFVKLLQVPLPEGILG